MGFLVVQPGMEPTPPAMEGKVLTAGPPGKSPIKTQISVSSHMPSGSSRSYFPLQNVLFRVSSEACGDLKAPLTSTMYHALGRSVLSDSVVPEWL